MQASFVRSLIGTAVMVLVLALSIGTAQTTEELTDPAPGDWPTYGRNLEMQRYSPLDQINRDNVNDLRLAWSRDVGIEGNAQFSPIVYDGAMYINGPDRVVALDATNGDLLWEYVTELDENTGFIINRSRGSAVVFDGKVFNALADGRLVALDAATGEELWSTQVGDIDFGEGFSSGPIFADGKLIVGPSGADIGGVPGRVVSVDVESGEILWTFNVIPQPGEAGYETWEPAESSIWGGGSAWNPGAYDPETRTVIYGTGQPIPWDNFGIRDPVSPDLYTASKVGLDVDTGELKWYRQHVPGDEWDYDQHPTPTVADLEIDGEMRRVLINPTTTGYLEVLDVETGEFLRGHAMMPEYAVHKGYEEDGTAIIDQSARFEEPGMMMLCPFRWVNYEPAAFSPETGLYYRPNTYDCREYTLNPLPDDWQPGESPLNFELTEQPDRFDRFGALSAIDPITGEVVWEFGHGYSQNAGAAVTGGGLVFGAFPDRIFRAFDAETGEVLWQQVVSAAMHGSPITYEVEGKQYVAVPVGTTASFTGQTGLPPTVTGDTAIFVFALPDETLAGQ